jgi:hypothetical protein
MNQAQFIHDYAAKTCDKFNPKIFTRSDEEIIDKIEKIILSCQRNRFFTIKVKEFKVIDDYYEVNEILRRYQDFLQSKKSSNSKGEEDNRYNFIDLKQSCLKLLIATYYIATKDAYDTLDVIIAVPKVVDKFYFKINGSYYSAMYQIVDASTYNNNTSKSSKHCVTLKTTFQPIRIFRNTVTNKSKNYIPTTANDSISFTVYDNNTFTKSVETVLYIFAKMGYYGAMQFLGIANSIFLSDTDPNNPENYYTFKPQKTSEIFINVPKMLFDGNFVIQHVVFTLCNNVKKNITMNDMFSTKYWITCLGGKFSINNSYEKGINILESLEGIYDISTRDDIHLPWEYKKDVYSILRWMIYEYNNLKQKDNLNILTKKIRCADYIAAIYAAKLANNMYRLSRIKRMDLSAIRKVIITNPMYLVSQMSKSQLINFRNIVTDMDSLLALKFTYKGNSGIGESGGSSIPDVYRLLHISNMGILDPDASSPTDPGISGSVVPTLQSYGNGYFSEFEEPITWEDEYAKLYNSYKETKGMVEIMQFKKRVLNDTTITDEQIERAKDIGEVPENLMPNIAEMEGNSEYSGIPLEESGRITYEQYI